MAECRTPVADEVLAGDAEWLRAAVERAHAAPFAPGPAELPPAVVEACAEGAATVAALSAAARVRWDDVVGSAVRRRGAEMCLEALADLALAVPAWPIPDVTALRGSGVATGEWTARFDAATWRAAALAALADPAVPEHRPDDIRTTVADRAREVSATIEVEWVSPPDVFATALPLLARGVADVVVALVMGADARCSDLALRRFAYRRFRTRVAEGLTPRHLVRSRELLTEVLA